MAVKVGRKIVQPNLWLPLLSAVQSVQDPIAQPWQGNNVWDSTNHGGKCSSACWCFFWPWLLLLPHFEAPSVILTKQAMLVGLLTPLLACCSPILMPPHLEGFCCSYKKYKHKPNNRDLTLTPFFKLNFAPQPSGYSSRGTLGLPCAHPFLSHWTGEMYLAAQRKGAHPSVPCGGVEPPAPFRALFLWWQLLRYRPDTKTFAQERTKIQRILFLNTASMQASTASFWGCFCF